MIAEKFAILVTINLGAICFIGYHIGVIKAQLKYIINKLEGEEKNDDKCKKI